MMRNQLARLHQFITDHYDLEELRTLCYHLGVNYDALRGEGTAAKSRELVLLLGRERRFDELLVVLRRGRPEVLNETDLSEDAEALYDALPAWQESVARTGQRAVDARGAQIGVLGDGAHVEGGIHYHTESGAHVEGKVDTGGGDFVGRDKLVRGDEVHGDKTAVESLYQLMVSPWGLITLAVILAISIVLAAVILGGKPKVLIGSLSPVAVPTLPAFDPAGEGETLVIVAKFDDRSEGQLVGVDPSSSIYDFVLQAALDNAESHVRVEWFEGDVANSGAAQKLGEQYGARLVIWGWHNSLKAQPYVELIGERTVRGEGTILETSKLMAFYFLEDIPSQATYLGLFTLGMTHVVVHSSAELRQAIAFFDAAVESIVEGTQIKPWEAYMWRANCYLWLGEYETALQDYDHALSLNPDDTPGHYNRAIAHSNLGDHKAAIADYTEAIHIKPDYAEAYVNRSAARRELGDFEGAIADCTEAIRIKPDFAEAYFNRAIAHSNLDDHTAAIADYTEAIRIKPDFAEAYFNRANAYSTLGGPENFEAALADLRRYLELRPDTDNRRLVEDWIADLDVKLSGP